MKKLLIFALFMLPLLANADEVMVDGIKYIVDMDTKTAEVIGSYNNEDKLVYIPSTVTVETVRMMTYRVTSIAEGAFRNHQMEELYLPESLETIGDQAFAHCTNMKSIILGESVTTIGSGAFHDTGLEHIYVCASQIPETFPDNSGTPDNTDWAKMTLHVPACLVEDYKNSDQPYWGDVRDENIVALPAQRFVEVKTGDFEYTIDEIAMTAEVTGYGNNEAKNLTVPSTIESADNTYCVTSIGERALSSNDHVVSLTVSEGVKIIENGAFAHCHSLREISLPNSVVIVGSYAFDRCTYLRYLSMGTGVRSIGHDAFVETGGLEDLYIYAPQIPMTSKSTDDNPSNELSSPIKVHVPAGLVEEYRKSDLPNWRNVNDRDYVALPEGVNKGEAVVDGIKYKLNEKAMTAEAAGLADSTITDLVIPASITVEGKEYQVQSIGNNAFFENFFSSITLSEGLKTIGRASFMFSWKVKKIILPNSVESIGVCSFDHSFAEVFVFGEGIKTIGEGAIKSLPLLKELYIYARQIPNIVPWTEDFPDETTWYAVKLYVPNDLVEEYRQSRSELPYFNEVRDEKILPISKDYESFLTSIRTVKSESYKAARFSLDGRRLTSPQKGINIIRMTDGTVRKEIVR